METTDEYLNERNGRLIHDCERLIVDTEIAERDEAWLEWNGRRWILVPWSPVGTVLQLRSLCHDCDPS